MSRALRGHRPGPAILCYTVGGRPPPSLSLVLKCEREQGTSVIPASKRRAKGGPLRRAEQCGADHAASQPSMQDRHSGRSSLLVMRSVRSAHPQRCFSSRPSQRPGDGGAAQPLMMMIFIGTLFCVPIKIHRDANGLHHRHLVKWLYIK